MNKKQPQPDHPNSSIKPVPRRRRPRPGRQHRNPLDYDHPYESMAEFARLLNLRYATNRTRHAYYRDMRLVHEHFGGDPATLTEEQFRDWGVHVQPVGDGAIRYLGAYVCRTAIADARLVRLGEHGLTFTWKDRAHGGRVRTETITGHEFVRRYLRHVLPRGLRSIRHFGFCHPAARRTAERVRFFSGRPLHSGPVPVPDAKADPSFPLCPSCNRPMPQVARLSNAWARGPPVTA